MEHTATYGLTQWDGTDRIQMADFNSDNLKLEQALTTLAAQAGNCRIAAGSYTGTGTYGSGNKNTLTFDFVPMAVILDTHTVSGYNSVPQYYILFQGCTEGFSFGHNDHLTVAWSGRTVTWYFGKSDSSGAKYQFNTKGQTYHYIVIGT